MKELQVFQNEQFGEVRTVLQDGQPWFVAADVCNALGLKDTSKALARLDDDEGTRIKIPHPQSEHKMLEVNVVNEPGLYTLVLGSRKPEAKAFKRWITHEVIPSIRRTGSYGVPNGLADTIIKLADCVNNLSRRIEALEKPQALPPPSTMEKKRWLRLVNKKLDLIVEITGDTRNEILHMAYAYVEQAYEVDLNEERLKYMDRTSSNGTVIEIIYLNKDYKYAFENALNYYLPPTCQNW